MSNISADSTRKPHADKDTVRLSLTLSGAIALGAYEAGIVAQLAYAIGKWNEQRPMEPPYVIVDVIAGASAGAITGSMLACHIMRGTDPAEFVRIMHAQWCNTTFNEILAPSKVVPHALLSAEPLDSDGKGMFKEKKPFLDKDRDQIKPGKAYFNDLVNSASKPDRVRQKEVVFSCTLTSLDPIPFRYKIDASPANVEGDDIMMGLTRKDFITFSVACDKHDSGAASVVELPEGKRYDPRARHVGWDRLFWVSIASGAFPVAWEPLILARPNFDFLPPWGEEPGYAHLRYSDGGVLNNLPFIRASEAVLQLQDEPQPDEQRLYIIIEPEPDKAKDSANCFADAAPRRDTETPLLTVVNKVVEALREQSFNMDVLEAQKVNRRLQAREAFYPQLLADAVTGLATEELVQERITQVTKTLQEFLDKRASHHSNKHAGKHAGRRNVGDVLTAYHQEYAKEQSADADHRTLRDTLTSMSSQSRKDLFLLISPCWTTRRTCTANTRSNSCASTPNIPKTWQARYWVTLAAC